MHRVYDGADLFELAIVEVDQHGAFVDRDAAVFYFFAEVGQQFDFGLRRACIPDLAGGDAEDLAKRFFCQIDIGFGEFFESEVYLFFYIDDIFSEIIGFEEEKGEEFFVVFFEFCQSQTEFGEPGCG